LRVVDRTTRKFWIAYALPTKSPGRSDLGFMRAMPPFALITPGGTTLGAFVLVVERV
jgi:hypothetical protein